MQILLRVSGIAIPSQKYFQCQSWFTL